jgi:hypothetical protein
MANDIMTDYIMMAKDILVNHHIMLIYIIISVYPRHNDEWHHDNGIKTNGIMVNDIKMIYSNIMTDNS